MIELLAWIFRRISVWTGRIALYLIRSLPFRYQQIFDQRTAEEIAWQKMREQNCSHKYRKLWICLKCDKNNWADDPKKESEEK